MPIVLLIRHGENDFMKKKRLAGRLAGVGLNEAGQMQAKGLAEKLKDMPIKAVYASPLERTHETAVPLAEALKLDVITRTGLLEIDYGEWQGKTFKYLEKQSVWKTIQSTPSLVRFPGGETFSEAQSRACKEIDELCQLHPEKEMFACVTHADIIRLVVAYYLEMPLDHYQRLYIGPASVTVLNIENERISLISMNHEFAFPYHHQ